MAEFEGTPVLDSKMEVPRERPCSSDYPPIYFSYNVASQKWERCSQERKGDEGVRMFSRFHSTLITVPGAINKSEAEKALAASQPALAQLSKDLAHDACTQAKASSLSIIHEFANFENFILM